MESWNWDRIYSVFTFQFDSENPLIFTGLDFWIFFLAVMVAYTILEFKYFLRVLFFITTVAIISIVFKNGDLVVAVGGFTLMYAFTYALLKAQKKKKVLFAVLLLVSFLLTVYYFWFKLAHDKIYFTINPIDVWLLFLGLTLVLSFLHKSVLVRSFFLTGLSLFFYFKSSEYFVLLLVSSLLINYSLGKAIYNSKKQINKKWIIAISAIINLFILGYFKYTYFFTDSWNNMFGTEYIPTNMFAEFGNWMMGDNSFTTNILLPVGVSFFTFQSISYVVDIYREEIKPVNNFFDYTFFVTFFPQLVAGPIVRARDFIPQISQPYKLEKDDFSWAVIQIVTGLLKKVVLADFIAVHFIDKVADAPDAYPGFVSILAMWGYSLQIYGDFSGYTDIAIGLSRLMGFKLLENFNSPYKAINVADFWRRWHKSLGSWLRDYLYIPLGGNRSGGIGTFIATFLILVFLIFITQWYELLYVYGGLMIIYLVVVRFIPNAAKNVYRDMNLIITMVIGGLWHGASENFVIWGAMNGAALVFFNHWKKISPYENKTGWLVHFWKIFITFNFITFTRIWFRLEDDGLPAIMLNQIWHHFDFTWDRFVLVLSTYQSVFYIMLAGYIIHWLPSKVKDGYHKIFMKSPLPVQVIMVSVILFLMYQAMTGESKAFVYFQF